MYKVSIITICFNNLSELQDTMESVDMQRALPFEHIVVDGSTDPAISNFLETNPQPSYRKWKSERDKGISDAFNKGLAMATGDLVLMLNSGDAFFDPDSLANALRLFEEDPQLQWVHAKYEMFRGHKWIQIGKPFSRTKMYRGMRSICHQTMLVKKSLHDKYGVYDTELKIAMDYDFLLRIADEKFAFIETPLIKFAPGGASSQQYKRGLWEMRTCYEKYYGKSWKLDLWQMRLKLLHFLMGTKLGKFLYRIKTGLKLENM